MAEQTLVAVYDTAAHADAAVQALRAANVPSDAISQHGAASSGTGVGTAGSAAPVQERGFWASLFGGDTDDADTYSRSVASGSTVVTVRVPEEHVSRVSDILEAHDPIDFDERAATYSTSRTTETTGMVATPAMTTAASAAPVTTARSTAPATTGDDTIKIVEEKLTVGKRAVNRGGARVRTYVVETPVEEQVTLRDETVRVERRPVTDGRPVTDADFGERTIEMRETDEVAVVGKTARVVEEIGLRKETTERVETVRDTVRRTEVDIEDSTDVNRTAGTTSVSGSTGTTGRTGTVGSTGTGVGSSVDRALGTNMSGTNPGADAPDGTPGNPPGTMASRGVDKALGTNISGANPAGGAPDGTPGNPPGTEASRAVDKTLGTNISGANPTHKA